MAKSTQRNSGLNTFPSVSAMRAFAGGSGLQDDEVVFLASDANAGVFKWDASSSAADDGADVILITGWVGNGRFVRINIVPPA